MTVPQTKDRYRCSGSSSSTCCVRACLHLSSFAVLTLKMTFVNPLSCLISREADGELICTCSLPAVCWISRTQSISVSVWVLTPPWGCDESVSEPHKASNEIFFFFFILDWLCANLTHWGTHTRGDGLYRKSFDFTLWWPQYLDCLRVGFMGGTKPPNKRADLSPCLKASPPKWIPSVWICNRLVIVADFWALGI